MVTPVSLQLIGPSDVKDLLVMSRTTFYDAFERLNNPKDFEAYTSVAFTREKLLLEINHPDTEFYFALLDKEKIGYIKLNFKSAQTEFQDENAVEIERLYISTNYQGKQIGGQLLDFVAKKAVNAGLNYIWLGVWEYNFNALRFYERAGFKLFSSHTFWLGNDKQTDLLMKKEL